MAPPFELRTRGDKEIKTARGWPGKSKATKELAKSWTGEHGLQALRLLLDEVTGIAEFEPRRGVVGAQTSFDEFQGGRDHDLLLVGESAGGKTVVSVEGHTDDGFGQTLAEYRDTGRRKLGKNEATHVLDRMQGLTQCIGGWDAGADPKRLELPYRLFAGVAGATAAAVDEGADQAVLCVHELLVKGIDEKKRKQQDDDLRDFIYFVFETIVTGDAESWVVGPLKLRGGSERIPAGMPFYVAKLSTPPASAT